MIIPLGPTIPALAQALILTAADDDWEDALQSGYGEYPSPNRGSYRSPRRVRCVVWHITQGSYGSALNWLRSPESKASANDLISRTGYVANLVPGDEAPWTNGQVHLPVYSQPIVAQTVAQGRNPNTVSYTIECAGYTSRGLGGSLTAEQLAALIIRTAQACMEYYLTADTEHILRHSHWDSVDRADCPGYSRAEMVDWVSAVRALTQEWRGW